eukprot:TRINITY_DN4044_c0_g1_i3.p1 TRINITY_DN4044_c0_g1~~TRINITY_DN4044_c0_g1_i3.p1  ORF type:complete len:322 (+),score=44.31 TRINITY_DN4044_c0_g1_i3:67-1032(+)
MIFEGLLKWAPILSALVYACLATAIVFVNKSLFVTFDFRFIFVITLGQLILSWVVSCGMGAMGLISIPRLNRDLFLEVMPLSLSFVANVIFGIAGLGAVNVPMYIALRRLGVLFTLILQRLLLKKMPSNLVISSVFVIIIGGFVAAMGDPQFDLKGYSLVLLNNITGALNLVSIKKSENKLGTFGLMHYNNIISIPLVTICAFVTGEWQKVINHPHISDTMFIVTFLTSGAFAFFLNYSLFVCTKLNSPLTTSVVVQLKNSTTTILGFGFLNADYRLTLDNLVGHTISTMGGGLYCYFSYIESQKKKYDEEKHSTPKVVTA